MRDSTAYQRHYQKNRERLIARSAETTRLRRVKLREMVAEIKEAAGCADCGTRRPARHLSFDHLPGVAKVGNIPDLIVRGISRQRILDEIAKCEVVCLLCHADRTHARSSETV